MHAYKSITLYITNIYQFLNGIMIIFIITNVKIVTIIAIYNLINLF